MSEKQLNPFELKSLITSILNKISGVKDIASCVNDFEVLDAQEDKSVISKLLFKELVSSTPEKASVICFMLERYVPEKELISKFWELLKNSSLQTDIKILIINLLREMDSDWSYETCEEFLGEQSQEILDENTKNLLNSAIINPEVQIDFMDFMASLTTQDKITLISSLAQDFSQDILANILIPVFESSPLSPEGKEALKLLSQTKSELALNVLERMGKYAKGELSQDIRKNLATLKMSGIRQDNTKNFYKEILADTTPDKFYVTYPDSRGDVAMIFTRKTKENRYRFVSIVINTDKGIKDCFGFFDVSQFECEKILERFLKNEYVSDISAQNFRVILNNAEILTLSNNPDGWKLPYEYICWRNLLVDIDFEDELIEQILKTQILPSVSENVFETLEKNGITKHWFMDLYYSDEVEELLKEIKDSNNLESLIKEHLPKIFYEEEIISWKKKILLSAYIKYSAGFEQDAEEIYGLIQSEKLINNLFEQILQRSIYEYLVFIKYNKDSNINGLSAEEINDKIKYIEEKWIKNV